MIIVVENLVAGISGTGAVFENYILIHRLRERDWARHGLLKCQSPPLVTYFLQRGHTPNPSNTLKEFPYLVSKISNV